jgi:hypothetical protein
MFSLTSYYSYYLYRHPTDMRKSFDALCGLIQEEIHRLPALGEVYLFLNKPRNRIKLLRWEQGGFVLYYKRLEEGTFNPVKKAGQGNTCQIQYPEMVLLIEGIDVQNMVWRKRYRG